MSKYHKKSHCKYLIKIHLVFVTKYRKNIINGIFRDDLLQILYDISLEKGFYASKYKKCMEKRYNYKKKTILKRKPKYLLLYQHQHQYQTCFAPANLVAVRFFGIFRAVPSVSSMCYLGYLTSFFGKRQ